MSARNQNAIAFITGLVLLCALVWAPLVAQDIPDAVVKVFAERDGKTAASTGFVWQSPKGERYIVTTLHSVIGSDNIYFDVAIKKLNVVKIDRESDLALLQPKDKNRFNLKDKPALSLAPPEPQKDRTYTIYGFPAGVKLPQGDGLRFSNARHMVAMKDYLPNDVLSGVTQRGFPEATFKVLRVSSGITPGHSGAPIVDPTTNAVIGIGSGGLSFRGYERVNWAVPAQLYLPKLETSGEGPEALKKLKPPKDEAFHFSATSEEPAMARTEKNTFYGTYTIPLSEIYLALDDDLRLMIDDLSKEFNYDFKNEVLDIYSDVSTGASIAVPTGVLLKTDGERFMAEAANGRLLMMVQISETGSFEESQSLMYEFDDYVMSQADWESELPPEEEKEFEEEGWWEKTRFMTAWAYDAGTDEDFALHWLSADYSIEYEPGFADFLGVAVMLFDVPEVGNQEEILYQTMSICTQLSGFAMD